MKTNPATATSSFDSKVKRLSGDFTAGSAVASLLNRKPISVAPTAAMGPEMRSGTVSAEKPEPTAVELTDLQEVRRSIVHSFTVRFIGSTQLRRRQTYPMLSWIITDLLYQSKCVGMDLSSCITACLMAENEQERSKQFQRLKQQLTEDRPDNNGLIVRMDIVTAPGADNESTGSPQHHHHHQQQHYAFQICNPLDGQTLLRHKLDRIFLFGKYSRSQTGTLFYYIHKSDDDVVNSIPTIYLFQAIDPEQLAQICMKFTELRPKLPGAPTGKPTGGNDDKPPPETIGDVFVYNPLLDQNNPVTGNNNCFEVRHIGSVVVTQKRATPAIIDRAAEKFHSLDQNESSNNTNNGTTVEDSQPKPKSPITEIMMAEELTTSTVSGGSGGRSSVKPTVITTSQRRQYRKNRFLVQLIEENENRDDDGGSGGGTETTEHPLMPVENRRQPTPPPPPPPPPVPVPVPSNIDNSAREQNKTMLFIIGTMDFCLISPEKYRTIYTKVFSNICHCSQGSKHPDHFGVIVREPYVPPTTGLEPPPSSKPAATTNSPGATTENFVLHIFQCQTESVVSDLLCALRQSFNNAFRHQNKAGQTTPTPVVAAAAANPSPLMFSSNENLPQATNAAANASTTTTTTPAQVCQNCPMNWFHQLSIDIYGLDDVKIYAMLLYRIKHNSSERRWREYHSVFEYLQLQSLSQKVDLLVIMLKARVEKMQRYHEIRDGQCRMDIVSLYDQIEQHDPVLRQYQQQKSTLSLNRLEGLRLMAKSSLTNTFDAFRKRNRVSNNSQSNEHLPPHQQQQQQQPKRLSQSPSSSLLNLVARAASITTGGGGSSAAVTPEYSPPMQLSPSASSSSEAAKNAGYHRRNTVADCYPPESVAPLPPPPPIDPNASVGIFAGSSSSSSPACSSPAAATANTKLRFFGSPEKITTGSGSGGQALMNIYLKTSSGAALPSGKFSSMEELRQQLNEVLDPQLLQTGSSVLEPDDELEEQLPSPLPLAATATTATATTAIKEPAAATVQARHRLFRRIRKSLNQYEAKREEAACRRHTESNKARQLWQFAIRKQIQLLKQEKARAHLKQQQKPEPEVKSNKAEPPPVPAPGRSEPEPVVQRTGPRVHHPYTDIPPIETQSQLEMVTLQWRKLMDMFDQYCHNNPDDTDGGTLVDWWSHYERSLAEALRMGIPKEHRSQVWRFLARYHRFRQRAVGQKPGLPRPPTGHNYRQLLRQLAIHQHAIFVDLGRTFPTIPYFAEPMGPGQLALYNLLKAYSLLDKEVEYCQGLSFVAGILLLHTNEEDAFDLLCYVLYDCGLREQYKPSMDALQMQMYQLNRLLYDLNRPLYDHLDRLDISPTLYAAPSFLTLFASLFPVAFVARVFDLLMHFGLEAIFRVFYQLIDRIKDDLLACADFERIMELMRTRLLSLTTEEMCRLFEKCLHGPGFGARLDQYRLEYKILQEEFVHLNQINKMAVEQKLHSQKKQMEQQQQQIGRQNQMKSSSSPSSSSSSEQPSKMLVNGFHQPSAAAPEKSAASAAAEGSTVMENLRRENRRLAGENTRLREENIELRHQLDELTRQWRRQSR